ncbi:MAG: putative manganese-dependent inorganic diphosphatase [Erysipelotrichaceae bacterium]|nr:putative manganese-dependent inorganic diphosphatase [Erysipelotrichaceae bacterium]
MSEKIYVVGHKNPDTDSICSAITYAHLKQLQGVNAIACRLGPLNEETKFVLNQFGIENPLLLKDARCQLKDIEMDIPTLVHEDCSLKDAWDNMFVMKNKVLCVVNDIGALSGMVSVSNLVKPRLMSDEEVEELMKLAKVDTIARTIDGEIIVENPDYHCNGKVYVVTLSSEKQNSFEFKDAICILSDGEDKQRQLIEMGAAMMVITCNQWVSEEICDFAKEKGCVIVKTSNDTMKVAKTIQESFPIVTLMTRDLVTYKETEYVDDVSKKITNTRYRSYPVLRETGELAGAISRWHLLNYKKKKFILVDHSSKVQAINYIDDAEIEEIIDHHHIGNIETSRPIYFRNQRCGCTCTIIYQLYKEHGVVPSREMAGLMLSAILSDTLKFKSRTTTQLDIDTAHRLAELAEVDLDQYAMDMLSASVALKDATPTQILNRDLKTYEIGKYKIGIGQTNYRNMEDIQSILPVFKENMTLERRAKEYDLLIMMFTHVMAEGTMFVFSGKLSHVMQDIMKTSFNDRSGYDPDIISRKQQLVPMLSEILKKM